MGIVLQNLVGFAELDILKVLPVDLHDLQTGEGRAFYQTVRYINHQQNETMRLRSSVGESQQDFVFCALSPCISVKEVSE